MLPRDQAEKALRRLFRRERVVELDALFRVLQTRSRMSVFRRLREVGYLTSYTHAGRYYTLAEVPEFDEHGLWYHRGVGFSQTGTLKETLAEDVPASEAGRTHAELEGLLRLRVYNALLELVREGRIGRERFERVHLYLSAEGERAAEQLARRRELVRAEAPLPPGTVVEVLVEALRAAEVGIEPGTIVVRLRSRGVQVTPEQVSQVCAAYGLAAEKKTPPPPSRPSRP